MQDIECLWVCGRGPTRLRCQMHCLGDEVFELEVMRNMRVYGTYRFDGRTAALTFAGRLRDTFEGNGWVAA